MPTIDRMTPEGQRLMAELEKLNKLAAYIGFQSGTPAKERYGDAIVDSDVDLLDVALLLHVRQQEQFPEHGEGVSNFPPA